jgi:O-acetyl-ADP-ribose deacetylase (regulator of RNase III)
MPATTSERIRLVQGDITALDVDAVVTAANEALVGGHGVDGAIHRAAGPGLFAECREIGYCPEGEARITKGYLLRARHVIHTVGPVWEDGDHDEAELLRSCYRSSLELAEANGIKSIAFPCIATGAHEYPHDQACGIAISTVVEWLAVHALPNEVIFCCFENADFEHYQTQLRLR